MKKAKKWVVDEDGQIESLAADFRRDGPMSRENIIELYGGVRHMLPESHQTYLDNLEAGSTDLDPLMHLEMLMVMMTAYSTQAIEWSMEAGKANRDLAPIIGELRQTAAAVENIRVKRQEAADKRGDETGVVDPTRQSPLSFFENFHRESSEGGEGEGN